VIKGPGYVSAAKRNITEKYWEKFGRPEWAQLVNTDTVLSLMIVHMLLSPQ